MPHIKIDIPQEVQGQAIKEVQDLINAYVETPNKTTGGKILRMVARYIPLSLIIKIIQNKKLI